MHMRLRHFGSSRSSWYFMTSINLAAKYEAETEASRLVYLIKGSMFSIRFIGSAFRSLSRSFAFCVSL